MSGHSKWANTKHRKAYKDAKKNILFTKIIKELVTASNVGGPDPKTNYKLRHIISKALLNNMQKDLIKRSIERGQNIINKEQLLLNDTFKDDNFFYTFGKIGEFILIQVDNTIKIIYINDVIKKTFNKQIYLFKDKEQLSFYKKYYSLLCDIKTCLSYKRLEHFLLKTNIEDIFWTNEYNLKIIFNPYLFKTITDILIKNRVIIIEHKVIIIPINKISLTEKVKYTFLKKFNILKNIKEIKNIFHNIIE